MSNDLDLHKLAVFIESGQAEVYIHSEKLKAALESGTLSAALMNNNYKWHRHPGPECCSGYHHPSCAAYGQEAMCCHVELTVADEFICAHGGEIHWPE